MYDVAIVGGGVAGAALAAGLGRQGRKVLLIERDLRPPQLFVGELLQPGGVASLEALDLSSCIEDIDAQPTQGFAVVHDGSGQALDYPRYHAAAANGSRPVRGWAFHHGRFVGRLREAATRTPGVEVQQGTVVNLCREAGRVCGVGYRDPKGAELEVRAHVVVAADGRNSRLRRELGALQPQRLSYSVGVLLRGAELPYPGYGHVFVTEGSPMLGYRIGSDEVRVLVDVRGELPPTRTGELARYLSEVVAPRFPEQLREPFLCSVSEQQLRAMPNYTLSPRPESQPGAVLLGDALNMRHPVTGGGMTVALNDVRVLVDELANVAIAEHGEVDRCVARFYRNRHALSLTIDALANALYDVFRAEEPGLEGMRAAMLRYWQLGGPAKDGPVSLLAGLAPRPAVLLLHYTAVALLGMGSSLAPRGYAPAQLSPDIRGASQVASGAFATIKPHLQRVFGST